MTYQSKNIYRSGGYTLVEVLVGILIFAVGMMALAQLQGNLAQNSSDANARTVAINVAEEIVESVRSFAQITSDGSTRAYNDIVDSTDTVTRAGYTYSVVTDVTDYYYVTASKTFTDTRPEGSAAANSDFKHIELTVSWEEDGGREFRIDDDTTADMGSGSITITDVISSITSPATGKVILGTGGDDTMYAPPVDYSPGQNPDIVSINLGKNKFKESTTPLPDVIRTDELVETRFDVVTYSNPINSGATFLRREEFIAVSCECTLRLPTTDAQGGLRPTVWNGSDYTEGEFVSKPYGESANNQQSQFCDICCRDHHDGGIGTEDDSLDSGRSQYGPFRSENEYHTGSGLSGDHKHYNRDSNGNLVLAEADGETYVEACRMVRKDGFFRVAQDMRQESLNAFPADYLDEQAEIDEYSGFVTAAVDNYSDGLDQSDAFLPYESSPPGFDSPSDHSVTFPASNPFFPTQMSESGVSEQQLRSRGIYIDYMSDELRKKIRCLNARPTDSTYDCDVPEVSSALEIIPFYDVQLTWLSRWNESPNNNPVDVTNQAINDHNSHSRGMAMLTEGKGSSTISSIVHTSNLGLTGTDPVDPYYVADEAQYNLYATADDSSTPPTLSGIKVSGQIISTVPGVKAADVEIAGTEALCDRTNTGFDCALIADAKSPSLKVTNYTKADKLLYACSAELLLAPPRGHVSLNGTGNWTNFSLEVAATLVTDILIKEGGC
jgi:type IV pilus modification protein PilV